ncbi:MAG: tetratricopeptide repeat protein [Gaiellaceae bacterium]
MARGTQHRKRRPAQNARPAAIEASRKQKPPQWQEELFFQRLRTHAKWAYVFLAAAFLATFVLLGVGSGSNGLSDLFQNAFNFGSSGTSIGKLQSKASKHPLDATAWRDLATAYEQKQRPSDAIVALKQYTGLRSKDPSGYTELAAQYGQLAQKYASDYQNAQLEAALAAPATLFAPPASTTFGKIFSDPSGLQDPIDQVIQSQASAKEETAYANYQEAEANAEDAFKTLAKLTPDDVTVQYQLGQAAQSAGDYPTAVAAYKKFLRLSPTDVDAPQVKALLKQVEAQAAADAASASASG